MTARGNKKTASARTTRKQMSQGSEREEIARSELTELMDEECCRGGDLPCGCRHVARAEAPDEMGANDLEETDFAMDPEQSL